MLPESDFINTTILIVILLQNAKYRDRSFRQALRAGYRLTSLLLGFFPNVPFVDALLISVRGEN